MKDSVFWGILVCAGAGTFLTRISFIHLFRNKQMPAVLSKLLRFVPPAVLSALILPVILVQDGQIDLSFENGQICGAVVAAVTAVFSKNTIMIIGTGMTYLWLHQWILI